MDAQQCRNADFFENVILLQKCEIRYETVFEQQCTTVQEQQCSTVNEQECTTVQVRMILGTFLGWATKTICHTMNLFLLLLTDGQQISTRCSTMSS